MDAPCVISDSPGGKLLSSLGLAWHGVGLATIREGAIELRLAAAGKGTATVTTADFVVTAEVRGSVTVRPRAADPIDGWLQLRSAGLRAVSGDHVSVYVRLPPMVHTKTEPSPSFACTAVTLLHTDDAPPAGTEVYLVPDRSTPLRVDDEGPVVATVSPFVPQLVAEPGILPRAGGQLPGGDPARAAAGTGNPALQVTELQRRTGARRVAVVGDAAIAYGWLESAAFAAPQPKPPPPVAPWVAPPAPAAAQPTRCPAEVPIFVRDADAVVRAGAYKPNGAIASVRYGSPRPGEVAVDLGGTQTIDRVYAFVRQNDLAGCAAP